MVSDLETKIFVSSSLLLGKSTITFLSAVPTKYMYRDMFGK
jgi:hypothetical protein